MSKIRRDQCEDNPIIGLYHKQKARIAELEAEVKLWQQQSNQHYLYSCELDKTVADKNERIAELQAAIRWATPLISGQPHITKRLESLLEQDK